MVIMYCHSNIGGRPPEHQSGRICADRTLGTTKVFEGLADSQAVTSSAVSDEFCLYLWRSLESPGILYLARSLDSARTVYEGLAHEGYIVKAVHLNSGTEFEMRGGALLPVHSGLTQ